MSAEAAVLITETGAFHTPFITGITLPEHRACAVCIYLSLVDDQRHAASVKQCQSRQRKNHSGATTTRHTTNRQMDKR